MYSRDGNHLFIDTNVLLDAVLPDRPQSDEACKVICRCNGDGDIGFVCPLSLKDTYYILTKDRGEKAARRALEFLTGLVAITGVSAEECLMSLNSNEPDFEDGLIRACAELNGADFIITRDAAAYRKSTIRAVTPAEYLEIVS